MRKKSYAVCCNFNEQEKVYIQRKIGELKLDWKDEQKELTKSLRLRIDAIQNFLDRLTDAYIEQAIEREVFERRKTKLLMEQKEVEERLAELEKTSQSIPDRLAEFLELAGSTYLQYEFGLTEQKRDLVRIITSNRQVDGKKLEFTVSFPFNEVANRFKNSNGAPYRDIPRTWDALLGKLVNYVSTDQIPKKQSL